MYAFIINPNARSGLGIRVWRQVENILHSRKVVYTAHITRYPGQATEFASELSSRLSPPVIVILGGDGTLNEVVCGLNNMSRITVGYIPIGSSNDFARSMKLPRDSDSAISQILNPREYTLVSVGRVAYQDTSRRFVVSSGIGFDADVCFHNTSSAFKRLMNRLHLGKVTYTGVALFRLLKMRRGHMSVVLDDRSKTVLNKACFVAAMNHPYEGGGFRFCPTADPSDSVLDVITISDLPKSLILLLLPTAFLGLHRFVPGIRLYKCGSFRVVSEYPLPVHTDGEAVTETNAVSFSLEKEKLRVISS